MSEFLPGVGSEKHAPERNQSGTDIWIACALLVLVPLLVVLAVKYLLHV